MTDSRTPLRSRSTAWQTIDGEAVLLRVRERELLGLSEVGRRIWELADGEHSVDAIVGALIAEFDVSREVAGADARRFIDELVTLGALELAPEARGG